MTAREAALSAALGTLLTALIISAVFLTGSTFGQRCAVDHTKGSAEWEQCIEKLSSGATHQTTGEGE